MPVKIGALEPFSEDEFERLRRKAGPKGNPAMDDLLDRVEGGAPIRVPLEGDQTARGLRVAIARAASKRGLHVETVEGDGFVAVRRVEEPRKRQTKASAGGQEGRTRGRPRKQAQPLDEALAAGDNERITPEPVNDPILEA